MRSNSYLVLLPNSSTYRAFPSLVSLYQFLTLEHSQWLHCIPSYHHIRVTIRSGQPVNFMVKGVTVTIKRNPNSPAQLKSEAPNDPQWCTFDVIAFHAFSHDRITLTKFRARSKMEARKLFLSYRTDLNPSDIYLQINRSRKQIAQPSSDH